ncbi:hypothetical protein ACI2OX_21360 [Bacillus sp. N9]
MNKKDTYMEKFKKLIAELQAQGIKVSICKRPMLKKKDANKSSFWVIRR